MVEYEETPIWNCPYCNKEYESLDDAMECATECADIEYSSEDSKTIFICGYCKKKFEDEEEAEGCEENHKERRDEFYSKVELKKASEHPAQKRLIVTAGGSR